MSEKRASKKQRELLNFIDGFIKGNGYGPSYREMMRALDYKSVSTVATHVDGLVARGYLRKTKNSARSLEVVSLDEPRPSPAGKEVDDHIEWLRSEIAKRESDPGLSSEVDTLKAALEVLEQE